MPGFEIRNIESSQVIEVVVRGHLSQADLVPRILQLIAGRQPIELRVNLVETTGIEEFDDDAFGLAYDAMMELGGVLVIERPRQRGN